MKINKDYNEWLKMDEVTPELAQKIKKLESMTSEKRKILFDELSQKIRKNKNI